MNDHSNFDDLERRLEHEATQFISSSVPTQRLVTLHRRRRVQRAVARSGLAAAVVLGAFWWLQPGDGNVADNNRAPSKPSTENDRPDSVRALPHDEDQRLSSTHETTAPGDDHRETLPDAPPQELGNDRGHLPAAWPKDARPFVIVLPAADSHRIVPGIYVPPRRDTVDVSQLNAPTRRAIRELLQRDGDRSFRGPI